jgi:hypothetical protein
LSLSTPTPTASSSIAPACHAPLHTTQSNRFAQALGGELILVVGDHTAGFAQRLEFFKSMFL